MSGEATAAILTIGNEIVSGDTENTNASWLARRLESLGVAVRLIAALPDEIDAIATFVRREAPLVDHLLVTGGLGGTPDDLTREAIAAAFRYLTRMRREDGSYRYSARYVATPTWVTAQAATALARKPLPLRD